MFDPIERVFMKIFDTNGRSWQKNALAVTGIILSMKTTRGIFRIHFGHIQLLFKIIRYGTLIEAY